MDLPSEVLNNVLQNLPKKDLKQLRLVCGSLVDKVAPFLFNSVFISLDPLDLEKAVLLLGTFAPMIKSVIISPIAYEQLTRPQYRKRVTTLKSVEPCPPRSRFNEHVKRGYSEYCIVQERASQLDTEHRLLQLFGTVLGSASFLKQVVITHRRRNTNLTGQELAKYCRHKACGMPAEMHGMFRVDPFQSTDGFYSPNLNNIVYMALTASGPNMVELVMDHENRITHPFSAGIDTFVILDGLLPRSFTALSKLTKLKLHVDKSRDPSPVLFRTGIVAQQLSYAVNLEHLYLGAVRMNDDWQFNDPSKSIFHYVLNGCHFQKLKTLVLDYCEMQGEELLPFLRTSPDLKELVLHCVSLDEYTWMDLISRVKADTRLRVLIMDCLTGGGLGTGHHFDPALRSKLPHYTDCADDIDEFYFGDGPNPFSTVALEQYIKKWFPAGLERFPVGKARDYMEAWC